MRIHAALVVTLVCGLTAVSFSGCQNNPVASLLSPGDTGKATAPVSTPGTLNADVCRGQLTELIHIMKDAGYQGITDEASQTKMEQLSITLEQCEQKGFLTPDQVARVSQENMQALEAMAKKMEQTVPQHLMDPKH